MKRLVAISILILLVLSVFVFPIGSFGSSVFYVSLAFAACALFLSSWNGGIKRGLEYLRLMPKWKDAPKLALQSFVLFIACCAVAMALSGIFFIFGILDTQGVYDKVVQLPLPALIAAFTLAPLGEEMFFRGFLFRKIGDLLGKRASGMAPWAISAIVSSAIFAILHSPYGSVAEVAVAFSIGVLLCAGVKKTNSLVPAVLAHAAFNFISIAMAVFL